MLAALNAASNRVGERLSEFTMRRETTVLDRENAMTKCKIPVKALPSVGLESIQVFTDNEGK